MDKPTGAHHPQVTHQPMSKSTTFDTKIHGDQGLLLKPQLQSNAGKLSVGGGGAGNLGCWYNQRAYKNYDGLLYRLPFHKIVCKVFHSQTSLIFRPRK